MFVLMLLLPLLTFGSSFVFFKRSGYEEILEEIEKARIVYLGEAHTHEEFHRFQLRVLRDLADRGYRLILLMEAFQQPFQDVIDAYVNCEISEEEFLEGTEYRKRWRFDPELYAPLWRFSKERNIPLFALNVPTELKEEVKEKGLEWVISRYLPPEIVPLNEKHREFLEWVMKQHRDIDEKKFIDVQLMWDNGMAYRIAKLAAGNPEAKLIVIVGRGHVWRGHGIPERVNYLLGEVPQAVLYVSDDEIYFLFSKDFSRETSSTNSSTEPN
ncbi:MAG TPA: hypothetical protein ENJ61_01580 [Aquifex aeolicus]|uniref:Haem-binding uptake Tiki superfamily ChaN domain-containing protein n=1 Tax=Aquifex aeolicus TaxID=63363 RepID=A0A7C5PYQ6_AQUAO|nr:hypothetical protein [Aquifex aeolicus]